MSFGKKSVRMTVCAIWLGKGQLREASMSIEVNSFNKLGKFSGILVAGVLASASAAAGDRTIRGNYSPDKVADNVYVIHGPNGFPNKKNQGFINNPVIVLTSKGVVIVDPGSSVYIGEMVVEQARKLSSKKIVAVFNTHVHGDHWMGNDGIRKHYPNVAIYAHPRMKAQVEGGSGDNWLGTINRLTDGAAKGTKVVGPNKTVTNGDVINVGSTDFRIHHNDKAHTDTDIMVEIVNERVLVCGDNVRERNIAPFIASFKGNIEIMNIGLATKANRFVPGHGKTDGKEVVIKFRSFLSELKGLVKQYYDQGLTDYQMKPKILKAMAKYKDWYGFDDNMGRIINTAFIEVEDESF